jgi:DNA-binding transcriptional MocR family regulator
MPAGALMGTVWVQEQKLYPSKTDTPKEVHDAEKDVAVSHSKVMALAQRIAQSIEQGGIAVGSRLRSIRDAAAKEGVGRNTVVEAYARWPHVAMWRRVPVRATTCASSPGLRAQLPPLHVTEAVDVVSLLREQLERHYEVRVGEGRPPASWIEGSELRQYLRRARSHGMAEIEHGYRTSWGYLPLRETIAHMLCERSIHVNERQVLLTQGANHALDLIVRQLLEAGDEVLVDAPGYYPLFGKLRLAKSRCWGSRVRLMGRTLMRWKRSCRRAAPRCSSRSRWRTTPRAARSACPRRTG